MLINLFFPLCVMTFLHSVCYHLKKKKKKAEGIERNCLLNIKNSLFAEGRDNNAIENTQ